MGAGEDELTSPHDSDVQLRLRSTDSLISVSCRVSSQPESTVEEEPEAQRDLNLTPSSATDKLWGVHPTFSSFLHLNFLSVAWE